jgi:hypothetical protein
VSNGGVLGRRNVPGVDGFSGVWSLREIANARRAGVWDRYVIEVFADTPVSYWKLDETGGTTAVDSAGGNKGTYTGGYTLNQAGIPSTGRPAVLFNGSSGYVNLGATAALNLTAAWTLEAWVYLTSTPNGCGVISEVYPGSGNVLYEIGFGFSAGGAALTVGYYTGSAWYVAAGAALSLNAWHHVVGTWDGTTLRLYADGAQVATATPAAKPVAGMDGLYIGKRHDNAGSAPFFPGRIDEVAIYSAALSAARITDHYNAGIGA